MAGNISKHFYEAVANKTCADFHHPGRTCLQAVQEAAAAGLSGSLKFYLPLCILPLLFKIKQWNEKKTWKEFLMNYCRCVFSGFFITTTGFWVFCMSYKIFKGFYLPLSVCLPSSLGAVFCGFMPRKFVHIDGIGLFNMYIEFLIKQSKRPLIVWLRNSLVGATCLYSLFNSIMIYYLYKIRSNRFWFVNIGSELKAIKRIEEDHGEGDESRVINCGHDASSCDEYLKKEFKNISLFAIGISLFKLVFPRISSIIKNPTNFLKTFYKKFDYGLLAFLVSSNGIFKYVFCRLNQQGKYPRNINCLIAAFLSSFGYVFYPRYIIFTMGMTSIIEVLYKYIEHCYETQNKELPKIMTFINRLPVSELVYMISIGITFQLRVIYPHLTNKFVHKMMSIGSGGRSDEVTKNYFKMMVGW